MSVVTANVCGGPITVIQSRGVGKTFWLGGAQYVICSTGHTAHGTD